MQHVRISWGDGGIEFMLIDSVSKYFGGGGMDRVYISQHVRILRGNHFNLCCRSMADMLLVTVWSAERTEQSSVKWMKSVQPLKECRYGTWKDRLSVSNWITINLSSFE
jgi:hypothetical protein